MQVGCRRPAARAGEIGGNDVHQRAEGAQIWRADGRCCARGSGRWCGHHGSGAGGAYPDDNPGHDDKHVAQPGDGPPGHAGVLRGVARLPAGLVQAVA
jgi:hypothetical protein